MSLVNEAEALRETVDELALGDASIEAWRLADARLFHALLEGQLEVRRLQGEMVALVKSSKPNWSWFQTHAALRSLRGILDELGVLRMCVRSRIYEIEDSAAHALP